MDARKAALKHYAGALLPPATIEPQPAGYWQALGVWHDRVLARLGDERIVRQDLARLGRSFVDMTTMWTDQTIDAQTETRPIEQVAAQIVRCRDQAWAQDLFLVMAAVHGLRYDAIESAAAMLLPPERRSLAAGCGFTPRGKRLAAGLLAYYTDPINLTRMMLLERSERFSYSRHMLVKPTDGRATANDLISPAAVNRALSACEGQLRGPSICLDIMHDADGSATVFLRQVLREARIREMNRTLFGDQVETIVLRFSQDLNTLEQHSIRRNGVHLANAIVRDLVGATISYRDDTSCSPTAAVSNLLQRLQRDDDERLALVEIYLNQAQATGSPHMMVRSERNMPIAATLNFLCRRGLNLLADIQDIRHLGVAFVPALARRAHPYAFKLRMLGRQGGAAVYYAGAHHSMANRRQFESYLKDQYDVTAIPTAQ